MLRKPGTQACSLLYAIDLEHEGRLCGWSGHCPSSDRAALTVVMVANSVGFRSYHE